MKCKKCKEDRNSVSTIVLIDKNHAVTYCMNCALENAISNKLKLENDPELIDDVTGERGAVKYVGHDVTYVLEKAAMRRLIACALEPEEYFALAKKYGAHQFELHSDFYDPTDGMAEQPFIC